MRRDSHSVRILGPLVAVLTALLGLPGPTLSHDYLPGHPQNAPVLLKGGNLFTVSGGVLESTDLLFENGRITAIGPDLPVPTGAEIIDVAGRNVYPGLIAANSSLGLTEIGAVRATEDASEVGLDKGEIRAWVAYNPDSEIIPTVRANGITTALVIPGGRLVMGRSSLINLDGWTVEDALEQPEVGLHLSWPSVSVGDNWWDERPIEEKKKDQAEERARLLGVFDDARAYFGAKQADSSIPVDSRWEGFVPLFEGRMRLFVHADDYRQIEQAVAFSREYGLKLAIVGGREAYQAAELLISNDVPVILGGTQRLPMREDDPYDFGYRTATMVYEAGIPFCISTGGGASGVRNLAIQAGHAVGFGLPAEVALRSITLSAAEILGVDKDLGSLEVGKKATLIVSKGDILDPLTAGVQMMFINGRAVDLSSKHTELYEKYRARQ